MWSSIWLMALAEKVLEQVRLGFMTAPDTWLLPALCPSSCITRPTLHPREDCVAGRSRTRTRRSTRPRDRVAHDVHVGDPDDAAVDVLAREEVDGPAALRGERAALP